MQVVIARRPVLLHAHMFKNAGSTFDWSLQRSFGDAFIDHRDDEQMKSGAAYLGPLLRDDASIRALSSHWVGFPLPQISEMDIHLAMFFRDPIERIRSVYDFERRQEPAATPGAKKAKELNFLEYVRWRSQSAVRPVIRNFHTRYCSGNYLGEDLEHMYESSMATIESTPLIGLVHRYDESMVLFEYHLEKYFPGIDLASRVQNSGAGNHGSVAQRRARVELELEPILALVQENNQYDLRLHRHVERHFERALTAVPDREHRLNQLRTRNACLD